MVNVFGTSQRPRGPPGPPGPSGHGKRGPVGRPGPPGPPGKIGKVGPRGEHGEKGERGLKGEDGTDGKDGERGSPGQRGTRGPKGDTGSRGEPGERGKVGPKGDVGPAGSIKDMCTWMSDTVLNNLQKTEEECHLVIEDTSKDIERDGERFIREWVSRTGKCNATADADFASKDLVKLPNDREAIIFHKNRYFIEDLVLIPHDRGSWGYICITFRTSSSQNQAVVSNYQDAQENYVEIYATDTEIGLTSTLTKQPFHYIIQHVNRNWTTFFLEYIGSEKNTTFKYDINDGEDTDTFSMENIDGEVEGIAIGARLDDTHFLQGEIASFVSYHREHAHTNGKFMPTSLRKLIISHQMVEKETSCLSTCDME